MIRRSLRFGIRLGTLAGLVFALFKIVQARKPLPAVPTGEDPWAAARPAPKPTRKPAPEAEPAPEALPDEPRLVAPTMLETTSLRRPSSRPDEPPFDPAATAPTLVPPSSPSSPPPSPRTDPAVEIAPDADEIVILDDDPPEAVTAIAEAAAAAPALEPPRKAVARKAPAKKAAPTQKAPAKKAAAKKAPARKAAAQKAPAKKAAAKKAAKRSPSTAWIDPDGGVCPTTHPVKAKLRSAIFHLPGMAAYARTVPDRCYPDEQSALDDGLRKAAR